MTDEGPGKSASAVISHAQCIFFLAVMDAAQPAIWTQEMMFDTARGKGHIFNGTLYVVFPELSRKCISKTSTLQVENFTVPP